MLEQLYKTTTKKTVNQYRERVPLVFDGDSVQEDGRLVQQRSENREYGHQCSQASDDDEPVESYYALDICIEGCKLFSHLYDKLCGLIGEFGVELVEFLIHIFHCVAFLQSFQGAITQRNYWPPQLWR